MANTIQYAQIFQKALDKQILAGSTSNWMEANAGQVIYKGGNSIKIPKLSTNGLGDYDRANGYAGGAITFGYETKTMTQDRSRSFLLDAMDVDETNFVSTAGAVMSTFQSENVIPEIDAYRYSSLAQQIMAKDKATYGYTASATTIMNTLKTEIDTIKDVTGDVNLVCCISRLVLSLLEQGTRLEKVQFTSGDIVTEVSSIDGVPLLPVPSARMKTKYIFNDGKTSGQEVGGFKAADDAKDINWIITPRIAPIAVSKTDKPKIIDPESNQDADAWKIAYRKYHDLWITDEKIKASHVSIKQAKA
ncbi:hypothetical protein FDB64_10810 [Clostridium botulinum]|uniref:hypothetical protein n=1 Tax=Clostridium botulinum TaxID=1491 RepID=UPI0013F112E4|nr:hypothetical protein [Clostridium botulinum]MBN1042379.1 hypothetical protein [Clostridium botulinum]MBN1059346.1 hypothetical protein [Clostridium botulinum]NFE83106.1 hypothetical protein [Clostridium botulinum]NFL35554.1 hypothetical protein [Clostridium botulinum]NFM02522.1 hypothetical protein [Clostridium botulinum]